MSKRRPVVLIHGYSDKGESFKKWEAILKARGYEITSILTCTYRSLTNEVTVKDIAEGLDRAIRDRIGPTEEFDAIVHSTGMLVIRTWLVSYAAREERCKRLKHLIGLAPATFGSPLAHKGRSLLGSIFKGNREDIFGPDFLEAGDRILNALELGSDFTWNLAQKDLFGEKAYYDLSPDTPYPFIFCGTRGYEGLRRLINDPGSDGTVRLAGCSLNARKIRLDLTQDPGRLSERSRLELEPWSTVDQIPLIPIEGVDHSTILTDPPRRLQDLVDAALQVETETGYMTWVKNNAVAIPASLEEWQQFIVRAVDERGDPITDYHMELFSRNGDPEGTITDEFNVHVHKFSGDASLRCFHVNLTDLMKKRLTNLWLRVIASSGSPLVCYYGYGSEKPIEGSNPTNGQGKWDAALDISPLLKGLTQPDGQKAGLFYPFTTTLIELMLNREPLPLKEPNDICWFARYRSSRQAAAA